jgi:hypothetical protein
MTNKIIGKYSGHSLDVWVDGVRILPHKSQALINHSPDGFNAGYGGSGPSQLSLAIMLHILKDDYDAIWCYGYFKDQFISNPKYFNKDFEFQVDIHKWATRQMKSRDYGK